MIGKIMKIFGYVNHPRNDGTEWAENTIEKFLKGGLVSDTDFLYATHILEMKPEKRGIRSDMKY